MSDMAQVPHPVVVPGRGTALVGPSVTILIDAPESHPVVADLAAAVVGGGDVPAALNHHARTLGPHLPAFAAVARHGETTFVLQRGDVSVDPAPPDAAPSPAGAPWRVHRSEAPAIWLALDAAAEGAETTVEHGSAPAAAVLVTVFAAPEVHPQPSPSAEPDPISSDGPTPSDEASEPVAAEPPDRPADPPGAPGTLIDRVPGVGDATPPAIPPAPAPPPPMAAPRPPVPPPPPGPASWTQPPPVDPPRPPPPPPEPPMPVAPPPMAAVAEPSATPPADHGHLDDDGLDGATISLTALRAAQAAAAEPAGPTVAAVHCEARHPNPTDLDRCRRCGEPIVDRTPSTIARPPLGQLRLPDGTTVLIDRPLLVGRNPRDEEGAFGEPARIVRLADPDGVLSRTHAAFQVDGWQVQVVDRESTNHTFVQLPGQPAQQLDPGQPVPIAPGTVIRLADEVVLTFDAEA